MENKKKATQSIEDIFGHFDRFVLPLWVNQGWSAKMQLPFESLLREDFRHKEVNYFRAMACARQLYTFSRRPQYRERADQLFASLVHYFYDENNGGWFFSIDLSGHPFDRRKDLYTHAFVIFACCEYFKASGREDVFAVIESTVNLIQDKFLLTDGLYYSVLSPDLGSSIQGPLQNPMMHLAEAYISALELTGEKKYCDMLHSIANAIFDVFVDPSTGCVTEKPVGSASNWIEPGHQFEWFSLMSLAKSVLDGTRLSSSIFMAFDVAQNSGVIGHAWGVVASLSLENQITDSTLRLWAQTEYLRALAARGDSKSIATLCEALDSFKLSFLTEQGWNECLSYTGEILRSDMPSTSLYHMDTSYSFVYEAMASGGL